MWKCERVDTNSRIITRIRFTVVVCGITCDTAQSGKTRKRNTVLDRYAPETQFLWSAPFFEFFHTVYRWMGRDNHKNKTEPFPPSWHPYTNPHFYKDSGYKCHRNPNRFFLWTEHCKCTHRNPARLACLNKLLNSRKGLDRRSQTEHRSVCLHKDWRSRIGTMDHDISRWVFLKVWKTGVEFSLNYRP